MRILRTDGSELYKILTFNLRTAFDRHGGAEYVAEVESQGTASTVFEERSPNFVFETEYGTMDGWINRTNVDGTTVIMGMVVKRSG